MTMKTPYTPTLNNPPLYQWERIYLLVKAGRYDRQARVSHRDKAAIAAAAGATEAYVTKLLTIFRKYLP